MEPSTSEENYGRPARYATYSNSSGNQIQIPEYRCQVCIKTFPLHRLVEIKIWWERLLILLVLVHRHRFSIEKARIENSRFNNNLNRQRPGLPGSSSYYVCHSHFSEICAHLMDILRLSHPDEIPNASLQFVQRALRVVNTVNNSTTKNTIQIRQFLEHYQQFLSTYWEGPGRVRHRQENQELFPSDMPVMSSEEAIDAFYDSTSDLPILTSDEVEETFQSGVYSTFERQESLEPVSQSTKSYPTPNLQSQTSSLKGVKPCRICGKRVRIIEVVSRWSKLFAIHVAFRRRKISTSDAVQLLETSARILMCPEHLKEACDEILEIFGVSAASYICLKDDETEKLRMVETNIEEMRSMLRLGEEKIIPHDFVKNCRMFIFKYGSDTQQGPQSRKNSKRRLSPELSPPAQKEGIIQDGTYYPPVAEPIVKRKTHNRSCRICAEPRAPDEMRSITSWFDRVLLLTVEILEKRFSTQKAQTTFKSAERLYVCSVHLHEAALSLLNILKIENPDCVMMTSYQSANIINSIFPIIDAEAEPIEHSSFLTQCHNFLKKYFVGRTNYRLQDL